ncbi:MAG: type II toxin-antitoxin system VapC family toxin [Acidobacteria bacterium]|nr:type II toxin-antitoxin system VapC family toxin [Acidobacteriota bacterium]
MRLLLDTHIWLWSLLEPDRLGRRVKRRLADPASELWLSPISVWELSVLARRGRVRLEAGFREWVETALDRATLREAHISTEVAMATYGIELAHQDPADRFLAATASVFDLTLVTADERLIEAKGIATLAND